jgi:hypothetical protein
MAWTDPNTYTAGAILTAAQLNAMQANALAGGPIYATEAARNTAIPSPFEGQRAYITGPTVAAPTGATFATLPSGICTIYNGSVWVCTTQIAGVTNTGGTTTSTSFTPTLTSGGTNVSVTIVTGTTAIVTQTAVLANSIAGAGAYMGTAVSGATTLAASTETALYNGGGAAQFFLASSTAILTGLTAGTNTFTLQYKVGGSGTATVQSRQLIVQGIA